MIKNIIVTGGAGFIGSNLIRYLFEHTNHNIINVDCLTYASNINSLKDVENSPRYTFEKIDICDSGALKQCFAKHQPDAVMNLAAESHVDRSIDSAAPFLKTNIMGTFTLLECTRHYLKNTSKDWFRFHHISTDEVYGDLSKTDPAFTEETQYKPSSPYSASKASSDHIVMAWHKTYNLPVLITNCSNNYGPYHHPEKLIPHIIISALNKKPLPVYGNGEQVRDWLYVTDHARALCTVLENGKIGETYNIGGNSECQNIDVVKNICAILNDLRPTENDYETLIKFVEDRPGHDLRYAINAQKICNELGFEPEVDFETGLKQTVKWYLDNQDWWQPILDEKYKLDRIGASS